MKSVSSIARRVTCVQGPRRPVQAPRRAVIACADFPRWTSIFEYLDHSGVRSVTPEEAVDMVDAGWALVDVRPKTKKPYAVDGAIDVPIFEVVDMSQLRTVPRKVAIRAIAHSVNGVTPMSLNDDFAQQVADLVGDRNVILMCEKGGDLNPAQPVPARSLSAAWKLRTAWNGDREEQKIAHLKGGTAAYIRGRNAKEDTE